MYFQNFWILSHFKNMMILKIYLALNHYKSQRTLPTTANLVPFFLYGCYFPWKKKLGSTFHSNSRNLSIITTRHGPFYLLCGTKFEKTVFPWIFHYFLIMKDIIMFKIHMGECLATPTHWATPTPKDHAPFL